MKPGTQTTLDLVRHGEIATDGLLCAGADEPLSQIGQTQLETLKNGIKWDIIVSSPYMRCHGFAKQLAHSLKVPHISNAVWQEIDFGEWTDIRRELIWKTNREQLLQLWTAPLDFTAPGGESMLDFVARIQTACAQLLQDYQGKTILLLTHAGVIRAILAHALGIDYHSTQKFSVGYAKINRLYAYPDNEFSLVRWGCSATELA